MAATRWEANFHWQEAFGEQNSDTWEASVAIGATVASVTSDDFPNDISVSAARLTLSMGENGRTNVSIGVETEDCQVRGLDLQLAVGGEQPACLDVCCRGSCGKGGKGLGKGKGIAVKDSIAHTMEDFHGHVMD